MKQKIIIFEGFEKVGKTTIATHMSKVIEIPYFKNPSQKEFFLVNSLNKLKIESEYLLTILQQTNLSIILDRHYPSEYAYANAYNRSTDLSFIRYLHKEYEKLDTYHIYCSKKHKDEFNDDLVKYEEQEKILQHYDEFYNVFPCNHLLILDTSSMILNNQVQKILDFLGD